MRRRITLGAYLIAAFFAVPALAQTRVHSDGRGYTMQSPGTTYAYRYDSGATYLRTGNFASYSARNGTVGSSYYAPTYRSDSFSNSRLGWSGSGTTFYRPSSTTYSRTYSAPTYRYNKR